MIEVHKFIHGIYMCAYSLLPRARSTVRSERT